MTCRKPVIYKGQLVIYTLTFYIWNGGGELLWSDILSTYFENEINK